jgi:uncharacterized membrane protein YbhN (UPF0104 family)
MSSSTGDVSEVPPPPPTEQEVALDEHKATRNLRHGLISLGVLVALVVGLVLAVPGLHQVGHHIADMWLPDVGLAILFEVLSCLGYVICFLQVFDRAPIRFAARVALSELAFGAAVSLGGAGSVAIGMLLLTERGAPAGRVAERSAVLFLLTSAINVITLGATGLLLWVGILPGKSDPLLSLAPGMAGVVVFVGFLMLPRIGDRVVKEDSHSRIAVAVRTTSRTVRATERVLFTTDWRLIGAIAYLWADIMVLVLCFWALGKTPPISTIVLAYQIGYLSNLLPIPGSIGVLDGSFVGLFVLYGVSAATATSATIVYHAISLWVPAMWGTAAFIMLRRTRNQPITLRPPREERRALKMARRARHDAEEAIAEQAELDGAGSDEAGSPRAGRGRSG